MGSKPRERFLAALSGAALDRPPVWLMRQAGRYLPGYRALRAEHSFWEVCQTPELSTRAALERLHRDARMIGGEFLDRQPIEEMVEILSFTVAHPPPLAFALEAERLV
ncbi:hypothetical protein B4Q13_22585 [Lacticaseibacillus rhamnosus]